MYEVQQGEGMKNVIFRLHIYRWAPKYPSDGLWLQEQWKSFLTADTGSG